MCVGVSHRGETGHAQRNERTRRGRTQKSTGTHAAIATADRPPLEGERGASPPPADDKEKHNRLLAELAEVEVELGALEDVAVAATNLAGARGDASCAHIARGREEQRRERGGIRVRKSAYVWAPPRAQVRHERERERGDAHGEGTRTVQATGVELVDDVGLDGGLGLAGGELLLGEGVLHGSGGVVGADAADGLAIVGLIPLAEGGGIDLDDGALDEGLGADELVVGGVVDDINNTDLLGDG